MNVGLNSLTGDLCLFLTLQQLSQFWYSDGTALALAKEASRAAEDGK